MRKMLRFVAVGLAFCVGARGQDKPASATDAAVTTLHAEAKLVTIPVVVRDKKGVLVQGLGQTDFVLKVDGQARTIRYFDKDTDLPLTLGLLVDTSQSQRTVLDEERTASTTFLQGILRTPAVEGKGVPDRAFVMQFAHEAELLQDLTDSKGKLQAGLKQIDGGNGGQDDSGGHSAGHGTVLYDAVFLSGNELMAKQTGRKALVILSDGDDRGSKKTLVQSIEAAQRADTVIYAIYFKGEEHGGYGGDHGGGGNYGGGHGGHGGGGGGYPGGGGGGQGGGYPGGGGGGGGRGGGHEDHVDGKKVLERMCAETGGRLFEVKGKETVAAIYTEIGEELRSQYRLGYSPTAADAGDGYHQLDVTVPTQPKDRVQTRDGYYAGK